MSNTLPVLIAGGGIGGLATAIGLAQKGIRSLVLKKAL
jgi:3-hydroxybenzoate 6-monooxygenase